ncbi:MAG: hypothetical protein KF726_14275 [Anaerolineae bacterium]|nr:hypothetical protein [Anaerolineae bacterium]
MGQRANLLIVDESGYQLYYCHWCAISLDVDLFWGPEYAIPLVQKQRAVNTDNWLNNQWAEGGAVIDRRQQVLILFGGEELFFDIPLRRLYLELLRQVWNGWQVRWAHNGVLDLSDYVHFPRDEMLFIKEIANHMPSLHPPMDKRQIGIIGSFVLEDDSLRFFPLSFSLVYKLEALLNTGPHLIELARNTESLDYLPLDQWTNDFPKGGFHIDLPAKQILCWHVNAPEIKSYLNQAWQGWETLWLGDAYEPHLERIRGRVTLPSVDIGELLTRLEEFLVHRPLRSDDQRVKLVARIAQMESEGYEVRNNEFALRDDPLQLDSATRRRIFDQAVAGWQKDRGG